jgi:predicted transcriptional regulator
MKRSRDMIISKILEICVDGASKTRIVYQANLNFRTVNPYLELLSRNSLIAIKEGPIVIYETTSKGKELLESFRIIQSELSEL